MSPQIRRPRTGLGPLFEGIAGGGEPANSPGARKPRRAALVRKGARAPGAASVPGGQGATQAELEAALAQVRRLLSSGRGELTRVTNRLVSVKTRVSELAREEDKLRRMLGLRLTRRRGIKGGRRPPGHGQAGRITVLEEAIEASPAGREIAVRDVVERHGFPDRKRAAEALAIIASRGFLEAVGRGRYRRSGPSR